MLLGVSEGWMIRAWLGWLRGRKGVGDNTSARGWVTAPPEGQVWVDKEIRTSICGTAVGKGEARGQVWKSAMKLGQIQGFKIILREMTGGGLGVSGWKKGTMHSQNYNTIYIIQYPLAPTSKREIPIWVCSFESISLFCIPPWLGGKFRAYLLGEIPVK